MKPSFLAILFVIIVALCLPAVGIAKSGRYNSDSRPSKSTIASIFSSDDDEKPVKKGKKSSSKKSKSSKSKSSKSSKSRK